MKRIIIVGKNSYVGTSVKKYLEQEPKKYQLAELDAKSDNWQKNDFSKFDVVFYVAGIAHINSKKEMERKKDLYYKVNTNLAEMIAKKAKESGVKQFIYMSSMSVYGDSAPIGKERLIEKNTQPKPTNVYGDSKLQAEIKLNKLASKKFKVALLRPPMIYGANCKGNYQTLRRIALKTMVFPKVKNSRSMIYIKNFAEFVKQIIDSDVSGTFFPDNMEPVSTYEMVKEIAKWNHKRIISVPGFGWALKLTSHFTSIVNKAFGNMTYSKQLRSDGDYCKYSTVESVEDIESEIQRAKR